MPAQRIAPGLEKHSSTRPKGYLRRRRSYLPPRSPDRYVPHWCPTSHETSCQPIRTEVLSCGYPPIGSLDCRGTFMLIISCFPATHFFLLCHAFQLLSSACRAFFLTDFLEAARYTFVFPADRLPCLRTKSVRSLMTDPVRK